MSVLKAFMLPEVLVGQLSQIVKDTGRSESYYVVQALKQYFEDYGDAQITKDRFTDPRSRIVSGKEMRKNLGI